jgi:hypothetical protein
MTRSAIDDLRRFLQDIWMDNSPEEAEAQWRVKARHFPNYCEKMLAALEAVLADAPAELPRVLDEDGWIPLYHESSDPELDDVDFSFDETVAWLRDMTDRFRAIAEEEAS